MKVKDIRVCVLRLEGTNCEEETAYSFRQLGADAEIIHLKQLTGDVREDEKRSLGDYQCLMIPGGFSSGDYVRAGAIWAARVKSAIGGDLIEFIEDGYPVGGICNGFQVLVELGVLPGLGGTMAAEPEIALTINDSDRFECRPTLLEHENTCVFTGSIPVGMISLMPSAHAEGKLTLPLGEEDKYLGKLIDNNQIVFRYVDPDGEYSGYPWNPNGSIYNIAGICNPEGNVFGMMPHPERAYERLMLPDWTRNTGSSNAEEYADGRLYFASVLDYVCSKF